MRPPFRALILLLVLAAQASCVGVSPPGTSFTSEPSGARLLIDGRDSGWVTPCQLALDESESHVVTLTLEGHAPRTVVLVPEERLGVVDLNQGVNGVRSTIRFPVLLPAGDLFFPFRAASLLVPGRVFVRLRPADAP